MPDSQTPATVDDYERMLGLVTGFWVTQVVRAAATLNLAERLAAGIDTAVRMVHLPRKLVSLTPTSTASVSVRMAKNAGWPDNGPWWKWTTWKSNWEYGGAAWAMP